MKSSTSAAVVLSMLLLAAPAAAQPPGHPQGGRGQSAQGGQDRQQSQSRKWWQNPRAAELGLTAEQSKRIEEIFQATLPALRTCNSELEKREARLSDMVSAADVTEADVSRLIDQVEASRSEMSKARTLMIFRMYRVLTPEQRERVKALYEQGDRDRRRGPEPRT